MSSADDLTPEQADALREEVERLESRVESHPALAVIQQMEELDRAMWWYAGNAAECLATIQSLGRDGLGTRLIVTGEVAYDDGEHRDFVLRLGRTWHNFVAGAKTFADHMRLQFDGQPEDFRAEYEQKKRELLDPQDVVAFVSRARNVLLHGGVFQTGVTWKFTQRSESFEADCRTDILLGRYASWWNAGARRYIESKAPRLDLSAAIEEHAAVVDSLYRWYQDRFYEYHYPTIREWETLAKRLREASERLNPGSMPEVESPVFFAEPAQRRAVRPPPKRPKSRANAKRRKRKKR